jgi:DNA-binding beta-propeller fold protein YncE
VSLQESNELLAIDVERGEIAWKHKVGKQPAGLAITPDDRYVAIGIMGEDYVEIVDARSPKTVKKLKTALGAHAFRPLGDKRHLLVSNRANNTVSLLDMTDWRIVTSFKTPSGPDCMEVSADMKTLYLTARWDKQLVVMDLPSGKITKTIKVGNSPHGVFLANRAGPL